MTEGDYRMHFITYYRTEYSYQPFTTMWAGHVMQTDVFDYTVSDSAGQTEPEKVRTTSRNDHTQNQASWLESRSKLH